jgi:NifU-like protein involved in Fe-S cluster formation
MGNKYSELKEKLVFHYELIKGKNLDEIIRIDTDLEDEITKAYENDEISSEQYEELLSGGGYNKNYDV